MYINLTVIDGSYTISAGWVLLVIDRHSGMWCICAILLQHVCLLAAGLIIDQITAPTRKHNAIKNGIICMAPLIPPPTHLKCIRLSICLLKLSPPVASYKWLHSFSIQNLLIYCPRTSYIVL